MHRFFIIFLLSLSTILSGCSLPGTLDETGDITANTILLESPGMSMLIPKTWSNSGVENIAPPRIGKVVGAYISSETTGGFANNLVILEDTLEKLMTSAQYSEINNIQSSKSYLEYKNIKSSDITFADGTLSRLFVFRARYNQSTPELQYIQTARVCSGKVYLLHFTLSLSKDPDLYSKLFESFSCK